MTMKEESLAIFQTLNASQKQEILAMIREMIAQNEKAAAHG